MVSVHHAQTHTMTQWLKSQFIHVKQLLNPLCKLLIEVFIPHYITVITLLTYSSSRSLTLPFPFLGQSLTVLPWPDNPPTGGGLHSNSHVWMHLGCQVMCGPAGDRSRDCATWEGQEETRTRLSWAGTAWTQLGHFSASQAATDWGDGQHHTPCLDTNTVGSASLELTQSEICSGLCPI